MLGRYTNGPADDNIAQRQEYAKGFFELQKESPDFEENQG